MAKIEFHLQEVVDILGNKEFQDISNVRLDGEVIKFNFKGIIPVKISYKEFKGNILILNITVDNALYISQWILNLILKIFNKIDITDAIKYKDNKIYLDVDKISDSINVNSITQNDQIILIEGKIVQLKLPNEWDNSFSIFWVILKL